MSRRFIRENSQIIAGVLLSGFIGAQYLYRVNTPNTARDVYEFRTPKDTYIGISQINQEELRKLGLRLSSNFSRKIDFFRSNTIDFVSFGFCNVKNGAIIGLPPSYFAKSGDDLSHLMPTNGNFLGKKFSKQDFDEKIDKNALSGLEESLVLSDDAKKFALLRELTKTNNVLMSNLDKLVDFVSLAGAYWYSYTKTRTFKMQLGQRRMVYLISGLSAGIVIMGSRLLIQRYLDTVFDTETCQLGLDCCEGSIEYFTKLIERNKILRKIVPDGEKLIDEEGNYLVRPFRVPLTDYYIYFPNYGLPLKDRKLVCQREMIKLVVRLNEELEKKNRIEEKMESVAPAQTNDKEWEIFKKIRLFLESSKKNE